MHILLSVDYYFLLDVTVRFDNQLVVTDSSVYTAAASVLRDAAEATARHEASVYVCYCLPCFYELVAVCQCRTCSPALRSTACGQYCIHCTGSAASSDGGALLLLLAR